MAWGRGWREESYLAAAQGLVFGSAEWLNGVRRGDRRLVADVREEGARTA